MLLWRSNQHRMTIQPSGLHPISSMSIHFFLDYPISQSNRNSIEGVKIRKPSCSPPPQNTIHIKDLAVFMHIYIDWTIDVKGDCKCGYRDVSTLLGEGEENDTFSCQHLIKVLKAHEESYTNLHGKKQQQ